MVVAAAWTAASSEAGPVREAVRGFILVPRAWEPVLRGTGMARSGEARAGAPAGVLRASLGQEDAVSRKLRVKAVVVAALVALIAGAMLATGSGEPAAHALGAVR